jgi:hypothetical protein
MRGLATAHEHFEIGTLCGRQRQRRSGLPHDAQQTLAARCPKAIYVTLH